MPAGGDDGLEVVADLLPPVHEDAGTLELIEHAEGYELGLECGEQLMPDFGQLLAVAKLREIVSRDVPPSLQHLMVDRDRLL